MLRNRIAYFVVLISLVLLVYLYEDGITYMALYVALILPVLSLLLTSLLRRQFITEEALSKDSIVKGEEVQYTLIVKNNSILPCTSVRVRFKASSAAIDTDFTDKFFTIAPFKSHDVSFTLTAKYRGNFPVGIEHITLFDFLGLFRFQQAFNANGKKHTPLTLCVTPQVADVSNLPISISAQGIENVQNKLYEEDVTIVSDLRKYYPTDGYKKIHWKATAKKNELISKNFQSTKRNIASVVIDNGLIAGDEREALMLEDAIMESAVSILSYLHKRMYLSSLYYMGCESDDGITGSFDYLYSDAAKVRFSYESAFAAFMHNFSKMHVDNENLVVLAQDITDTLYASLLSMKHFGNNVMLIYFKEPKQSERRIISHLHEVNIYAAHWRTEVLGLQQ